MKLAPAASLQLKVDPASSNTIYIGEATPGVATSDAYWRIFKVDTASGITIGYAGGDAGFKHVWDSRTSLSYS